MPYLEQIVDSLNKTLKSSLNLNIQAYGVAETMINVTDTEPPKVIRYPAIIDSEGEATMIEVNDVYPVMVYHRIDTVQNGIAPIKQQYGRTPELIEVSNMAMIIISFRDKIRKTAYWLENVMKDKFPSAINGASVRIGTSNFDKLSLLQREYSEVELNFPQLIIFELKYQIQNTYKKGCFDVCDDCNINFSN